MNFKKLRRWQWFSGWCWSLGKGVCLCTVTKPVCTGSSHTRWLKMWWCWETHVMIGTLKEKQMSPPKKDFRITCLLTYSDLFNWISASVIQGHCWHFNTLHCVPGRKQSASKRQPVLKCVYTIDKQKINILQNVMYFADCITWQRLTLILCLNQMRLPQNQNINPRTQQNQPWWPSGQCSPVALVSCMSYCF